MKDYKTPIVVTKTVQTLAGYVPLCENTVMHNKHLVFTADIDASFDGMLSLGHGKTKYASSYIEITDKTLAVRHYYAEPSEIAVIEHGLDIKDYVTVNIDTELVTADITIYTSTGVFTQKAASWAGRNGEIFMEKSGSVLKNAKINWFCDDYSRDIWLFGDSYFNTGYKTRWPYYLREDGYANHFMTGYPGMATEPAIVQFKDSLNYGKPKFAVWCMGMNNGDKDGAINEGWLRATEEFVSLCRELDIVPILSTIPSTPEVANDQKNAYVRAAGCRYIDFNRAVGADKDINWYPGMLSHDQVHPDTAGAAALYQQVLVDFPEITYK